MKKVRNNNKNTCGAWARIAKNAAANALLFAIALGLFLALGLRSGGDASAASAAPLGFTESLRVDTAVYKGKKGAKTALLIAASWDASSLEGIAETLEKANCRATFALSLDVLLKRPALAARLAGRGHELALAAGQESEEKPFEELMNELSEAARLIEAAAGERAGLIYAGRGDAIIRASRRLGLTAVKGSIDLICERGGAGDILSRAKGNISGGDIVVCTPTTAFSDALSDILEYFSLSGLTAATVSGTIYD
ncbi:MAG: polysaccharide deacetylase family protein [Clostridia bacterium]|nr:polysaccharide deacetylase family protein [Clostridia bacterium]